MVKEIVVEDVLSIALAESAGVGARLCIRYVNLNQVRERLRVRGVIFDMGIREIETVRRRFPESIFIESEQIQIYKNPDIVRVLNNRVVKLDSEEVIAIRNILRIAE